MIHVSIPVAFFSGILSFFAPCVLPLLPAYIGYVTGVSFNELKKSGYKSFRKKLLISSLLYILGFSIVFTLLGSAAGGIGTAFRSHSRALQLTGGVLLVIFGLQFGGFIRLKPFMKEYHFTLPPSVENLSYLRAFFIGVIFSLAWSPCIGPILGTILALAAVEGTAINGAILLFVYSLGISFPFLIVSLTLLSAPRYLQAFNKYIHIITRLASVFLIALGILMVTGYYAHLNSWLLSFGKVGMLQ